MIKPENFEREMSRERSVGPLWLRLKHPIQRGTCAEHTTGYNRAG